MQVGCRVLRTSCNMVFLRLLVLFIRPWKRLNSHFYRAGDLLSMQALWLWPQPVQFPVSVEQKMDYVLKHSAEHSDIGAQSCSPSEFSGSQEGSGVSLPLARQSFLPELLHLASAQQEVERIVEGRLLFIWCSHGCRSTPSPLFCQHITGLLFGVLLKPCARGLCFSWEAQSPAVIFICRKKSKPVQSDKAGIVLYAQTEACQRLQALNIPWAVLAQKPQAAERSECHLREDSLSPGEGEGSL